MGKIVVKFGGSSLADAAQFRKVRDIIRMDPRRCYVVPSAPGRRFPEDEKITDLLYQTYRAQRNGENIEPIFRRVRERYLSIAEELGLSFPIARELDEVEQLIREGASEDFCASRGEYLNGLLLADYLGFAFLDPKDLVFFNDDGTFDSERTNDVMAEKLKAVPQAVIPGFYGSIRNGEVHTFSRGGSDISGSIVARAAYAEMYENWTDVNGFLMADPNIRNTNAPEEIGTMITHGAVEEPNPYVITGIAGRLGFSVISVEKAMMNGEVGFGRKVLQAVEEFGLSFEHMPTGIDTMCVVLSTAELEPVKEQLTRRIWETTNPDTLTIHDNMGIIATVGRGMVHNPGTAARLFTALSRYHINVRMIDQGSSELSILVGVDSGEFQQAIRAIYDEFVSE